MILNFVPRDFHGQMWDKAGHQRDKKGARRKMSRNLYIPVHLGLWESTKFRRLCRYVQAHSEEERLLIMAHLCHLWFWILRDFPSGTTTGCVPEDIAEFSKWRGDPEIWLSGLLESELLNVVESVSYQIPNWERYAGRLLAYRQKEAERKARYRQRLNAKKIKETSKNIPRDSLETSDKSLKLKAESKKKFSREEVEAIYLIYPKKTTKKERLEAIGKLLEEGVDYEFLRSRTEQFAQSPLAQERKAKGMLQDPVRFFKHRRFEDDPAEWNRQNGKSQMQFDLPRGPEI